MTLLGRGFTGNVLAGLLTSEGCEFVCTRRSPGAGSTDVRFDLSDLSTWKDLPSAGPVVVMFPPDPVDLVQRWADSAGLQSRRVVVIGTTSSYRGVDRDGWVTEESLLDLAVPRVRGEEELRARGAVVLRSAGIYGRSGSVTRNPLDWLRRGTIESPERFVNLVHVEDLALAVRAALEAPVAGRQFIVSDGSPRRWGEIAAWARTQGLVGDVRYREGTGRQSRRVSNAVLSSVLLPELRHPDLFPELARLESPAP